MLARVQDNGETSAPFSLSNGVKQGCVPAPTLFSLMFPAMLTDAFRNSDAGIDFTGFTPMVQSLTYGGCKQKPM